MNKDENNEISPNLRAWLDQETPAEREELERVWELLGTSRPAPDSLPDADKTWAALEQHVVRTNHTGSTRRDRGPVRSHVGHRRSASSVSMWLMAAIVIMFAAMAGAIWFSQPVSVTAPAGERLSHILPDESSVELSGGSTLSYPRGFWQLPFIPAGERVVTIEGEVFFDVQGEVRSFVVETFNARIEVLGTQFDVQAWPGTTRPETRITLASGTVRVASRSLPDEAVTLESGYTSRVSGAVSPPTPPQAVDIHQALAWRQEGFYAADQPLSAILMRLQQRFGVEIVLRAPDVATEAMTLFYSQQVDLETILHDICVAKGLKYRPTSRGYEIIDRTNDLQ